MCQKQVESNLQQNKYLFQESKTMKRSIHTSNKISWKGNVWKWITCMHDRDNDTSIMQENKVPTIFLFLCFEWIIGMIVTQIFFFYVYGECQIFGPKQACGKSHTLHYTCLSKPSIGRPDFGWLDKMIDLLSFNSHACHVWLILKLLNSKTSYNLSSHFQAFSQFIH